ncbi:MAG: glycosyltransferase family 39 protein [Bryobacter sp.]|nr:glycosyltransferase family 39 protein [Bryobacter sp.]
MPFRQSHLLFFLPLFCLAIVRGWLMPLPGSFTLDETGTLSFVNASFQDVLARVPGTIQSPLYILALWLWAQLFGLSEVSLRLPSVLAALGAAWYLYRLARRWDSPFTGLSAALLFLALPANIELFTQARQYSLAALAATFAACHLDLWLVSPRWPHCLSIAFALALLAHLHPLNAGFGLAIVVAVALPCPLRRLFLPAPQVATLFLLPLLLALPVFPQYLSNFRASDVFIYTPRPALADWSFLWENISPSGNLLLALLLAAVFFRTRFSPPVLPLARFRLLLLWLTLPPFFVFVFSRLSSPVFALRYFATAFPAFALLLVFALRLLQPHRARRIALACFVLLSVAAAWSSALWPQPGAFRAASLAIEQSAPPPSTPVLFNAGFIEGNALAFLQDPQYSHFLRAPLHPYPVPGRILLLPKHLTPTTQPYVDQLLAPLQQEPRIFIYSSDPHWHQHLRLHFGKSWYATSPHPYITDLRRLPSSTDNK